MVYIDISDHRLRYALRIVIDERIMSGDAQIRAIRDETIVMISMYDLPMLTIEYC